MRTSKPSSCMTSSVSTAMTSAGLKAVSEAQRQTHSRRKSCCSIGTWYSASTSSSTTFARSAGMYASPWSTASFVARSQTACRADPRTISTVCASPLYRA
jgi:hypothetical protein